MRCSLYFFFFSEFKFCGNKYNDSHTSFSDGNRFMCTAHIYCALRVKFGIRGLHMRLLSAFYIHENWHMEGHTSVAGRYSIHLHMYMKVYAMWIVKYALVNSLCYVREYTISSPVSYDHVKNEHSVF